jgi:hypothetical protein
LNKTGLSFPTIVQAQSNAFDRQYERSRGRSRVCCSSAASIFVIPRWPCLKTLPHISLAHLVLYSKCALHKSQNQELYYNASSISVLCEKSRGLLRLAQHTLFCANRKMSMVGATRPAPRPTRQPHTNSACQHSSVLCTPRPSNIKHNHSYNHMVRWRLLGLTRATVSVSLAQVDNVGSVPQQIPPPLTLLAEPCFIDFSIQKTTGRDDDPSIIACIKVNECIRTSCKPSSLGFFALPATQNALRSTFAHSQPSQTQHPNLPFSTCYDIILASLHVFSVRRSLQKSPFLSLLPSFVLRWNPNVLY